MKARLHLSIEQALLKKIKNYAQERHISVSEMVEQYFKDLVKPTKKSNLIELIESLPKVELPYPDDVDFKKQYYEERASKYGF